LGEVLLTQQRARRLFPLLMELKLYSREWCSWCIDAKEYLEGRGYKFIEIDVGQDRDAYEEMKQLSEQSYVPTFVAGEYVLANFDTDQLERFLSEHQIRP
jgi:glutaredoxin 3